MRSIQISGASAPLINPSALQAARIAARVSVSTAVADVLAGLVFGADRRDHDLLLADLTAARVGGVR